MTFKEAIEDIVKCIQPVIGGKSLELAIQSLEKQIPMKLVDPDSCPSCEDGLGVECYRQLYCDNCGQKLDWD